MSKGQKIEDKVSVPDVRSKTKSGAQSELKAAGLKVSIKEAYSDDVAKGEVISQTPSHGSKVSKKYNCCDHSQQRQEGRSDGQRSKSSLLHGI